MKIYLYPHSRTEIAALITEPEPAVVAAHAYNPEEMSLNDAVMATRDLARETVPGGPHQIMWVPFPDDHAIVNAALARLMHEAMVSLQPEEPDTGQAKCADCVHVRVCEAAATLHAIGATIGTCPEFVPTPSEEEPNHE